MNIVYRTNLPFRKSDPHRLGRLRAFIFASLLLTSLPHTDFNALAASPDQSAAELCNYSLGARLLSQSTPSKAHPPSPARSDAMVNELLESPAKLYRKLRKEYAQSQNSRTPYLWREKGLNVVQTILADLNHRLEEGSVLELPEFHNEYLALQALRSRFIGILAQDIPYSQYNEAVLQWVKLMNGVLERTDSLIRGDYHEKLAGPEFQKLLNPEKGTFVLFTFDDLDDEFFLKIRSAPIYVHGLKRLPAFISKADFLAQRALALSQGDNTLPKLLPTQDSTLHIDGYPLGMKEYTYHDAGHSGFMYRRDLWLFETAGDTPENLVDDWDQTKDQIMEYLGELKQTDPDLYKAAFILFFEVIHERGYQYYLPFLEQQFRSTKWVDVVRKKLLSNYWTQRPVTLEQEALLEKARAWCHRLVSDMLVTTNYRRISQLKITLFERSKPRRALGDNGANIPRFPPRPVTYGDEDETAGMSSSNETTNTDASETHLEMIPKFRPIHPFTLKFWPSIHTYRGGPQGVHITGFDAATTHFGDHDTSIYEVSLAQIVVQENEFLSTENLHTMELLLKAKLMNLDIGASLKTPAGAFHVQEILVNPAGSFLSPQNVSLSDVNLSALENLLQANSSAQSVFSLPESAMHLNQVLVFKIKQILTLMQRQGVTEYTITPPPIVHRGISLRIDGNEVEVIAREPDTGPVTLHRYPLSQVSLQP